MLDQIVKDMYNYRGSGQSVLELGHRQDEFRFISIMTKREIRKFLQVPDNFRILLNQGGATAVYTALVKNLIGLKPAKKAMTMVTGFWSSQNFDELNKLCTTIKVVDTPKENNCTTMTKHDNWNIDNDASIFCFCSNETVNGFYQDFDTFPWHKIPKDCVVCVDMSSNIGTCTVPWDKVGVVYMGAQKNLGTAGCTITIVRDDLIGKAEKDVPILNDWETFEKSPDTYYNTPSIFPMYVTGLMCSYSNQLGGLGYYIELTRQKSEMFWNFLDNSNGYYFDKLTDKQYRSKVNMVFRVQDGNKEAEETFIREAAKEGIV